MKTYYYLLILFFLYGCANEKKQNVEYVSATYELLDDEIATTMPGTLRVAGDFWCGRTLLRATILYMCTKKRPVVKWE